MHTEDFETLQYEEDGEVKETDLDTHIYDTIPSLPTHPQNNSGKINEDSGYNYRVSIYFKPNEASENVQIDHTTVSTTAWDKEKKTNPSDILALGAALLRERDDNTNVDPTVSNWSNGSKNNQSAEPSNQAFGATLIIEREENESANVDTTVSSNRSNNDHLMEQPNQVFGAEAVKERKKSECECTGTNTTISPTCEKACDVQETASFSLNNRVSTEETLEDDSYEYSDGAITIKSKHNDAYGICTNI